MMKKSNDQGLRQVQRLTVRLDMLGTVIEVGTLAWSREERRAYFEYAQELLNAPLPLSPINLAVSSGVKPAPHHPFDGLHGLFNDSLPDGWGRLLLDRRLQKRNYNFQSLTPLDRLAYVGTGGMGALRYIPSQTFADSDNGDLNLDLDLDWLASEAEQVQRAVATADVDLLQRLEGGSAGARPKIMVGLDPANSKVIADLEAGLPTGYEAWLVKFRSIQDSKEIGSEEYSYALMATAAGIEMPPARLLKTARGNYFAVRRFDRTPNGNRHVHTASGILDIDHRAPQIDYDGLLRLTRVLTRDERYVRQMFRRMVFNVLARNRDDHSKNHAFQMNPDGTWHPTPAYDVTHSEGPAGEHSLAVAGEGRAPGRENIMSVAKAASIPKADADAIFEEVHDVIARWPDFAVSASLSERRTAEIDYFLNRRGKEPKGEVEISSTPFE